MGIYIGTSKLKKCYLGTTKAKKIYIGTTMIWQGATPVQKPSELTVTRAYTGQTVNNGYVCPAGVNMVGTASAVNGGVYTATYTPDENHVWSDTEDRAPVTVTMTVQYVWVKWNSIYTYSERSTEYTPSSFQELALTPNRNDYSAKEATAYTFNTANGKYAPSGTVNTRVKRTDETIIVQSNKYAFAPYSNTGSAPSEYDFCALSYNGTIQYNEVRMLATAGYRFKKMDSVGAYSKGSTNLGNVVSTDVNAYPQNGKQGDYWYVKSW